jgi:hypothetical protein
MRTTLFQMGLFNDAFSKHETSFTLNGKEWGISKTERERMREWMERERQSVGEKGL